MKKALLFLVGSTALNVYATIREIGTGQAYSTIQAAVNAAVSGDTCNIHTGTYIESITINVNGITLQNQIGENPILQGSIELNSSSNNSIDGLEITGWTAYTGGIHQNGGTGLTVKNCRLHDALGVTQPSGVYCRNATRVSISNNKINSLSGTGIVIISGHSTNNTYAGGIYISGNEVYNNGVDGIEIHGKYITLNNNFIHDNITTDWANTHPDGIQLLAADADGYSSVQHCVISNNTISNQTQNIFIEGQQSQDTQDIWAFNNIVYNTKTSVNGVNMATLGGVNAMIKFSKDVYFYNNTLGDIGTDGTSIHIQDCVNGSVHIKNNIIQNSVSYGVYVEDVNDISNGELNYNMYYVTAKDNLVWGTSFYSTLANFKAAVPLMETNGASGNPMINAFSSPTLNFGSPAIDVGVNLNGAGPAELNSDHNGMLRPSSGGWDIGAYQYTSPTGFQSTLASSPRISIYPNPVHDKVYFENILPETSNVSVEMNTIQGSKVFSKKVDLRSENSLDLSAIEPGIYFIQLSNELVQTSYKIVIAR